VASAPGPVATGRLCAHLRRGYRVRDQLDRRVAVGVLAVVGPKGLLVLAALSTRRLSRRLEPSDQLVFHGAIAPGHPAPVRGVRLERALPRHHLPVGVATFAAEVERQGVRG
jgi:hypothetical protein